MTKDKAILAAREGANSWQIPFVYYQIKNGQWMHGRKIWWQTHPHPEAKLDTLVYVEPALSYADGAARERELEKPRHAGALMQLSGTGPNGETIYAVPHNIWDEIRVVFPPDYFSGMPVPDQIAVDINLSPNEEEYDG